MDQSKWISLAERKLLGQDLIRSRQLNGPYNPDQLIWPAGIVPGWLRFSQLEVTSRNKIRIIIFYWTLILNWWSSWIILRIKCSGQIWVNSFIGIYWYLLLWSILTTEDFRVAEATITQNMINRHMWHENRIDLSLLQHLQKRHNMVRYTMRQNHFQCDDFRKKS